MQPEERPAGPAGEAGAGAAGEPVGEPLLFLVGCTASGKSEVALALAERSGAEVLSMDSMLVYRGMDVGTAKPTAAERARVRHHLLDLADPRETFTVQRWLEAAEGALAEVRSRGRAPLLAGGTAFYMKALLAGLFRGPPADPELRARLFERARAGGPELLHRELAAVDPASAARVHPRDLVRVVRSLEVWQQTGRPISDWQREWGWHGSRAAPKPYRAAGLAVPPAELGERILRRTRAMLEAGWVEEALRLRAGGGLGPTACQALGYAEVLRLADGEIDREGCAREIALRTRQFARRQRTWLRRFRGIEWVEAGGGRALGEIVADVERALFGARSAPPGEGAQEGA